MTKNERLKEVIRAAWEKNDVSCKKLNVEKLLASDFIDRFLGFAEAYDKEFNNDVFDTATKKWLKSGEEEYEYIKFFLNVTAIDYRVPITIYEFVAMTPDEHNAFQKKCERICALLDEKRALYQEFNTFYE